MFKLSLGGWGRPRSRQGPGRAAEALSPRRWAWVGFKLLVFVVVFLLVLLLDARVASQVPPGSPGSKTPLHEGRKSQTFQELDYLNLAWKVAEQWRTRANVSDQSPPPDQAMTQARIYDLAIAAAAAVGTSEDPRRRMEAISHELFRRRGFEILPPPKQGYRPEHLLIDEVLTRRAGAPIALALVYLVVGETLFPPLVLQAVTIPGGAAVRYEDGHLAVSAAVVPGQHGGLFREDRLHAQFGDGRPVPAGMGDFKPLTKDDLAGVLLGAMGDMAVARDEVLAARSFFSRAVELAPERVAYWIELASLLERLKDADGVGNALDHALRVNPDNVQALTRRAMFRRRSGELESAALDLRRAARVTTVKDSAIILQLAGLEQEMGLYDRAMEGYRQALALENSSLARNEIQRAIRELELQPLLKTLRGDSGYPAKFKALRGIARSPTPATPEVLIAALRDPNLRFAHLVWQNLKDMTGEEIKFSPEMWERWWAVRQSEQVER